MLDHDDEQFRTPPTCPRHPLYALDQLGCPLCAREHDDIGAPVLDPANSEPLRVEAPAPVVPALGRVMVRGCVHLDGPGECPRCAALRAGEARLRAASEIPAVLAATPSAVEVLRALAGSYEYEARHAQDRAAAVGAGETHREHELLAAEYGAVARVLRLVLSLHHTPTVAPGEREEQSR